MNVSEFCNNPLGIYLAIFSMQAFMRSVDEHCHNEKSAT